MNLEGKGRNSRLRRVDARGHACLEDRRHSAVYAIRARRPSVGGWDIGWRCGHVGAVGALFAADEGTDSVDDRHLGEAIRELVVEGGTLTRSLLGFASGQSTKWP